jgi:predicted dienelactone hydrolase
VRILEVFILFSLLLSLLGFFFSKAKRPAWLQIQPLIATAFIAMHGVMEGMRWQLIPSYVLTGILCLICLKATIKSGKLRHSSGHLRLMRIAAGIGIFVALLSAVLAVVLPVFELPKPTGPYRVGTTRFHWTDSTRGEPFTPDPADHRRLLVEVWYPAEVPDGIRPVPYLPESSQVFPPMIQLLFDYARQGGSAEWKADKSGWAPTFLLNHIGLVQSHSFRDVPVASANSAYPVLIFSHGYLIGHVRQNTALMEHLASHGYVIFSIAHPHETLFWTESDSSIVTLDPKNPLMIPQRDAALAQNSDSGVAEINAIVAAPTTAEKDARLRAYLNNRVANWYGTSGRLWLDDTRFVVQEIEKLNADTDQHIFGGCLDLSRLGVLGMSFGGKIVARFCAEDSRCRAGLDLDGGLPLLQALDNPPSQPMMVVYPAEREARYDLLYKRLDGTVYRVSLHRASHTHIMEFAIMLDPLLRLRAPRASKVLEIINAYALAFFDQELLGRISPLLTRASPYREAIFIKQKK